MKWAYLITTGKRVMVHFNLAMDHRGLIRDAPLIIFARLFRRRIIVHIHGGEFLVGSRMPNWFRFILKTALASGPVIVLSDVEREVLNRNVPKARTVVLPNCIDLSEAKRFERAFSDDADIRILYLGRIAEAKGIRTIYQALESLGSMGIRSRFVMAGAGPDQYLYVRMFRELLGKDFEFAGIVTGSEKTRLLKKCNVFVLPSMFEGMPMALLESMAFGLVPITTSVGSIPEVVKDGYTGIIVNGQSSEEIASAIKKLLADSAYMQRLGSNARQRIFEYCSPERYVNQLNMVYSYDEHINVPRCY
jgi:glycosyltransferase involved in cell wall biosynthesis